MKRTRRTSVLAAALLVLGSCSPPSGLPRYDHVVIVVEENKDAAQVMADPAFVSLASRGTVLTRMYGLAHPSQPNHIGLFSGALQGVTDNTQHDLAAPNLSTRLRDAGLTFASYAEGLPSVGSRAWASGRYVRRHNPAASFTNVPDAEILPFSSFPASFADLPTVSFVIPDLDNDMHDGGVRAGGAWLTANLDAYARWAVTHRSLLIVTFDEDDTTHPIDASPIATIFVGAGVGVGTLDTKADLYALLRFVLEACGCPPLGLDASAPVLVLPQG